MTSPNPNPYSAVTPLTDALFVAAALTVAAAAVLWAGAATSTYLTAGHLPTGSLSCALLALTRPGDPSAAWPPGSGVPGPVGYWTGTLLVIACATTVAFAGRQAWQHVGLGDPPGRDLRGIPGLAAATDLSRIAGRRQLIRRAHQLRPTLTPSAPATGGPHRPAARPDPQQLGYRLGRVGRQDLWSSVEDSAVILGPPRTGKGLHLVIPWVLDAPGPVVCTSTRPDTLAVTLATRASVGPVAIFDPQRLAGLPGGLRWSPIRGCETPRTALVRARGLASGAGWNRGTVSDGEFWSGQTETALRCLLHAAALGGRDAVDVYRWA